MNRSLTEPEIRYVFSHLDLMMDTKTLRDHFHYTQSSESQGQIIFIPHTGDVAISSINDVPLPFSSEVNSFYSIDMNGNLIFHQDLLKCAFYLLSGYDEHFVNKERDHWGRVKYQGSIQKQLGIIHRSIVNDYFELIFEGINHFLKHLNKPVLTKRKIFDSFGFLLSHDIDVLDKYGWPHFGFKIKELLGLTKTNHSRFRLLKATIQSAYQFVNPWRTNPYWNFEYLADLEKKQGIKASYYFLSKDKNGGSNYFFNEPRLTNLFSQLKKEEHEIGIHGTNKTITEKEALSSEISDLEKQAKTQISGGRQHRLWLDIKATFKHHQSVGLKYDSSFGFAEHEGFRNSFCLPFKPYDFEKQECIDLWQFPLMAMDVTLLSHRKMNNDMALASIATMVKEVKKHNGIFTLLWHNSFFDEALYPGVTELYETILKTISAQQSISLTGQQLITLLDDQKQ